MKINLEFIVFLAGLLLATVGLYLVYPPAALIVPGIILMAISLPGGNK
jgi:hypothetical protein